MAPFPTVAPTNDPNYLSHSRAISQPESDKSMGTLLTGVGNVLNAGIKVTDFLNKDSIDKQVYAQVDAAREEYTANLQNAKDSVLTSNSPQASGSSDVIPNEGATEFSGQSKKIDPNKIPLQVKHLDTYVGNLQGAYQAGKISNTYYYSRLNSIAKDLRSQYPGYREYIDQKISSITGVNPANALVNSLISDINRQGEGRDKERDRNMAALSSMNKEGVPFTNVVIEDYIAGKRTDADVRAWINEQNQREYLLKQTKAEREERKGSREEVSYQDRQDANYIASDTVTNYLKNMRLGAGLKTIDDIRQRLLEHQTNPEKQLDSEEALQLGQLVQAYELKAREDLTRQFKQRRRDGTSIEASLGGAGETAKFIDEALYPLKHIAKAIQDKDVPAVLYGTQLQEAVFRDGMTGREGMLKNTQMRRALQLGDAIKNMNPEFNRQLTEKFLLDNTIEPFKTWINESTKEMIVQPDARLTTVTAKVDEAKQRGIPLATVYNKLLKQSEIISDPKAPLQAKVNMAKAFFDPANLPLLTRFEREVTDADGKTRPGQNSVFTVLTRVTPELKRLADTPEGKAADLWGKYENWTAQSYKHLFGQDVKDLSNVELPKGSVMAWDTGQNRFKVMYKGTDLTTVNAAAILRNDRGVGTEAVNKNLREFFLSSGKTFEESLKTVNRINSSTQRLAEVAKAGGKDVGAFIINTLGEAGFSPNADNTYIPTSMAKSIFSSRLREQMEAQDKAR
jgi:hypothetical protein